MSNEINNTASSPQMNVYGAGHLHCYCLHRALVVMPSLALGVFASWLLNPLGLRVTLGPCLLSGRTFFQAPWVHSCSTWRPLSPWSSGDRVRVGQAGALHLGPVSFLTLVQGGVQGGVPPGSVLHLQSPPLSSSLRACWSISPPPASDLVLAFSPGKIWELKAP